MLRTVQSPLEYKIPRNRWHILRDLYKDHWPRHILSYYTLKTYLEWVTHNASLDVTIYTSDNNWQKHGTYVIVEFCGARCNVLFNTLQADENHDLLLKTFRCLPQNRAFTFAAFVEQMRPIVQIYEQNEEVHYENTCDTLLYHLPMKYSLQLPQTNKIGYHFKNLSLEDAPIIDSLWPHRYPGSDVFIENLIRYNITLGAYEEKTGTLCGWVVQEQIGTIGLLQVEDSFKRKGIGEQLVVHMAKLLANAGMDATATILATNRASRHLFHKLGFKIINQVSWYDIVYLRDVQSDSDKKEPTLKSGVLNA